MFDLYKKNEGEITVFGNLVLNSTTQARLNATQANCTLALRDLSGAVPADEANQTITLTYQANGNYSFTLASVDAVMTAGHYYQGTISKAGMLDTERTWGIISSDIESLTTQQKADVNAEVVDVLRTDTLSEMGVGAPPATPTLAEAVMYNYQALHCETISTPTLVTIKNNAGTAIAQATVTELVGSVTRAKFVSA